MEVISLVGLYFELAGGGGSGQSSLKYLRVFRAFRPLRILGKDKDLQHILNALLKAKNIRSDPLVLKPHAGEAGPSHHLATASPSGPRNKKRRVVATHARRVR